ncbi:DUF368 domain-containing protein [Salinispira pacifica]|uniref:Integral membrane protein n=1 Tax=Salinispira pacifica TaxID=1307761 RepID=V5WG52_9SPIO|nr:DUF368 domain-containing protein [Salinispira pacifica]AHC14146.1 hypothetical protein L21SP2_0721 [Salinispira pacifica]
MKSTPMTWLINGLKGMFIGMANAIPGVSGGTIAVITGIYEPLIEALGSVFSKDAKWRKTIPGVLPLLIPVVIGVFTGITLFANVIDLLFLSIPMQTQFLFIGLILGSLPFIIKQSGKTSFRWSYAIPLILGAGLLIWMALRAEAMGDRSALISAQQVIRQITPANIILIMIVGAIATGTMVIPGVSGSFLLVVIGMYATFKTMFVEGNLPVIGVFMVGAIAGLLLVSKLIAVLLEKFHGHTYFGIIGLVLGSAAFLWPGFTFDTDGYTSLLAFGIGFAAAFFLGTDKKEKLKTSATDSSPKSSDASPENSDTDSQASKGSRTTQKNEEE